LSVASELVAHLTPVLHERLPQHGGHGQ